MTKKENFHGQLNIEDITDTDQTHGKRVCNGFKVKNLEEYHDLYVETDTIMSADVFVLDAAKFLSAP